MSLLRLIQLTDLHLHASETGTLHGIPTLLSLEATLAHARTRHWPPDAVLLTGDLVSDDPAGYRHIRRLFGGLGLPILCIPGNHDDPLAMKHELHGEPFILGGTFDQEGWRIVLLSSHVAGATHGALSDPSLARLEEALATAAHRHCLICLHHHPVEMGSRWLDGIGLKNAGQLLETIDRHPHVRAVLWGHVHQSFEGQRRGVSLLATPSTCAQFLPGSDDFAVDSRPPGYRTLTLRPDGSLLTEVVWLEKRLAGSSRSAFSAA
jgi:3',5'-cyclic-AMP phosphodiesterase